MIFYSSEVGFTLLEINSHSIENLRKVIKAFNAQEYVENIVQCDATEYKVDKDKPIHMIVTETMQRALKKEPQVAITLNLAHKITHIDWDNNTVKKVGFQYVINENPGFIHKLLT